jgi:hypothetical protein
MVKEVETDVKGQRKADALALAFLIYNIYERKQREEKEDEVS